MTEREYREPRLNLISDKRQISHSKDRVSDISRKSLERKECKPEYNPASSLNRNEFPNLYFNSIHKLEQFTGFNSLQTNFITPSKPQNFSFQIQEQTYRSPIENDDLRSKVVLLENSLKSEIARREGQQEYIDMLKQALVTKLHDSGVLNFLLASKDSVQDNEINLYLELSKLQNIVDQHKQDKLVAENKTNNVSLALEKSKSENEQLNVSLREQSRVIEKTNENLDKLLVTISGFEEENKKLLTEKDSLLDYMEELSKKAERAQHETREKQVEIELKNNQIQQLRSKQNESSSNGIESETRLKMLMKDLKDVTELSKFMEDKLRVLAAENTKITKEHSILKNKFDAVQKEKEEPERRSKNEELTNSQSQAPKSNKATLKNNRRTDNQLLDNESRSDKDIPEKDSTESEIEIGRSHSDIQEQESRSTELSNEIGSLKSVVEDYKTKLERERLAKTEETRVLYQKFSELKKEIKNQKEEKARLEKTNCDLEQQLKEIKGRPQTQESRLLEENRETDQLHGKLQDFVQEVQAIKENLYKQETEAGNESLRKQVVDLIQKLFDQEIELTEGQRIRDGLLLEQKSQLDTISSLNIELKEKEEKCLLNEKALKQFEAAKSYFIRLGKWLEAIISEEEDVSMDSNISEPASNENSITKPLQEQLKVLLSERKILKIELTEAIHKNAILLQEKNRVENEFSVL